MNKGVEILLARMESNPEEFDVGYSTKWQQLISAYREILEPEDKKALDDALNKLLQQTFTEKVIKELLAPEEDDDMGKWFTKRGSATVSAGVTPVIPSITLETSEHLRAHLDALKREVEVRKKPVLKKQHKTLFGKLFNYS